MTNTITVLTQTFTLTALGKTSFANLDIVRRWKGRYVDSGETQIFYCLLLYRALDSRGEAGGAGDYLHYKTMCDAVREMLTPHQAGSQRSPLRPEATLVSLLRTRLGSTSSVMILFVLIISILHQTGHSQYDVVRLDPFRYVSPTLLVHRATAGDWDTINLTCPTNTKVRGVFSNYLKQLSCFNIIISSRLSRPK